jgi:lipopolysaccharide transport system permease protein
MTDTQMDVQPIKQNPIKEDLQYLWRRRSLVWTWTGYNLYTKYIDTKLGLVWIFLEPLVTAVVYSFAFGSLLGARTPRGGVPFICFYLSGIVLWQLFQSSVSRSIRSIVGKINLMTEVRFPRESAVLVDFGENLVDLIASFFVMLVILAFYGYYPNWNYLWIPPVFITLSFLTLGIMFFTSSLGVFIQDIGQVVQPVLRVLFFMSGVIFSVENVPAPFDKFLILNPILTIIESFRNIVLHNEAPNLYRLGSVFLLSIALLWYGYRYFKKKDATFVDHL